jgi:hypothetical protein
VYSGLTGSNLYTWTGEHQDDRFGLALAAAGDVDADGHADVIVGTPLATANAFRGRAYLYSGRTGTLIRSWTGQDFSFFAYSVAGVGDIDDDGRDDVLVGAPGGSEGFVYAYSGFDGSLLYSHSRVNQPFGGIIEAVGDMNADRVSEYVVAVPEFSRVGFKRGRTWLYSGKNAQILHFFDGDFDRDRFGWSVSAAGDVNRDGIPDFIVGAPSFALTPPNEGYATVFAGNDLWLRALPATVAVGEDITLATAMGTPGMPVLLFVTAVNSTPLFRPIAAAGIHDADGNWALTATVPVEPNLVAGTTLTLQAYSVNPAGRLIDTWDEQVTIE